MVPIAAASIGFALWNAFHIITLSTTLSGDCKIIGRVNSRKPIMNNSTKFAMREGLINGKTTRRSVVIQAPPATEEASSNST